MPTARQAIKKWFREHPKTFCPVLGQPICRYNGCGNATLRSDPRCNITLKSAMAERARAANDARPWLADVRISADGRRYILNFSFDRLTLQDFRNVIPASDRAYDEENYEWNVERRHWGALNSIFANFSEWDLELGRLRRANEN